MLRSSARSESGGLAWRSLALLLLSTVAWTSHPSPRLSHRNHGHPAPPPRPNILLIVADDLGWRDVGCHGSGIETPNIDALAREGVELDRFYVSPICSPTRAALMTGHSPIREGVQYTLGALAGSAYTLAERFHDAGYKTALSGKWHLQSARRGEHPNLQGFDHFYGLLGGLINYYTHKFGPWLHWQRNGVDVVEPGYATDLLGAETVRLIRERDAGRPFFYTLAFNAPHRPNQAPGSVRRKYRRRGLCIFGGPRCIFAAQVDVMDRNIGRVLTTLRSEGIAEETIVVFISDNGGDPWAGGSNFPFRGEKGTTFEGAYAFRPSFAGAGPWRAA